MDDRIHFPDSVSGLPVGGPVKFRDKVPEIPSEKTGLKAILDDLPKLVQRFSAIENQVKNVVTSVSGLVEKVKENPWGLDELVPGRRHCGTPASTILLALCGRVDTVEANLVLNDSGGTWSLIGYFPNANHYPCDRLKATVALISASAEEVIVKLNTSAAVNGCTDSTLQLRRIGEENIGGKLGDTEVVFVPD